MLLSFINLVLNPFCLVFFFFFATSNQSLYFESKGTNTQKLKSSSLSNLLPCVCIYGIINYLYCWSFFARRAKYLGSLPAKVLLVIHYRLGGYWF